jgi:hypothetical protein
MSIIFPILLIISVFSLHKIALTLMMMSSTSYHVEHFLSDGEWIMRHVDPRFQTGGLLIPIITQPNPSDPPPGFSEDYVDDVDDDSDGKVGIGFVDIGGGGRSSGRNSKRRKGKKTTRIINQNFPPSNQQSLPLENADSSSENIVQPKSKGPPLEAQGNVEKSNEGGGYAGKNNAGGFAGKPYCAEYAAGEPLPFFYNKLNMDGTTGGIDKRGPMLSANKLKLNNEMKAQNVPDELRPLIMAFSMIETNDLTLDQISDYMKSKTMQNGRCFGIMNVNFGHRSHLKLDGELSNDALNGLTDKYYAGTDKANAEKTIMKETVKVFNTSFTKLGIYCTILFHRGGSTLFNDNALGAHKDWHPQIFFDSVANTYNAIIKDTTLMTDDRRVWFDVKEV